MIRIQITERLIADAELLVDDAHQSLKDSGRYTDENLMIGAIGEAALIDYCWSNDLLIFKNDGRSSDLRLYSGHLASRAAKRVGTST